MKLQDKLIEEMTLVPMQVTSKESTNKELLTHLKSIDILSVTVQLFANIKEQENIFMASTDQRIAHPHSTSIEVNEFTCVLGISKNGIDYNSPDGQDCHLILLTLSPADDTTEHRKIISCFRSIVQNLDIRSSLYGPDSHDEILNIISQWEEDDHRKDDLI